MEFKLLSSYLLSLGVSHPDIKRHIEGDADEISAEENFKGDFPLYWLETPEPKLTISNGDLSMSWYSAFLVLIKSKGGQKADSYAIDQSLKIIQTLLAKLLEDYEDGVICLQDVKLSEIEMDQIDTHADNMVGFRISLPLISDMPVADTSILNDVPFKTPDIEYVESEFEDVSDLPFGYSRRWNYQCTGSKEGNGTEVILTIPHEYTQVYVELIYENTETKHKLVSSIFIDEIINSVVRLPYSKNPLA